MSRVAPFVKEAPPRCPRSSGQMSNPVGNRLPFYIYAYAPACIGYSLTHAWLCVVVRTLSLTHLSLLFHIVCRRVARDFVFMSSGNSEEEEEEEAPVARRSERREDKKFKKLTNAAWRNLSAILSFRIFTSNAAHMPPSTGV